MVRSPAERWPEFQRRYRMQLGQPAQRQLLNQLVVWAREGSLTALYGAGDKERNQAVVLRSVLEELLVSWEPLGRSFSRPWASLAWVDRACAVALQSRSFRYKTMVTAAWRAKALERWPLPATSGTAMSAPGSGDSHPRRAEAVPLP